MDQTAHVPPSPDQATGQRDGPAPVARATPYEVARLASTLAAYDGAAGSTAAPVDVAGLARMATFAIWGREITGTLRAVEPPVGTPPGMIDALAAARGESGPVPFDGPAAFAAALGAEVSRSAAERAQAAHLAAVAGDDAMAVLFAEAALRCDPNRQDLHDLISASRVRLAGMASATALIGAVPAAGATIVPPPARDAAGFPSGSGPSGPGQTASSDAVSLAPPTAPFGVDAAGESDGSSVLPTPDDPRATSPEASGEVLARPHPQSLLDVAAAPGVAGSPAGPPAAVVPPVSVRLPPMPAGHGRMADGPAAADPTRQGISGGIGLPISGLGLPTPNPDAARPSLAEVQAMERLLGVNFGVTAPSDVPSRRAADPRMFLAMGIILFVVALVIGFLVAGTA